MPGPNQSGNLFPTNFEGLTSEDVRRNLSSWDKDIIARRAQRLGISTEAASVIEGKPLFLMEAEQRSKAEGRPLSSVLAEYSDALRNSQYPAPSCLLPDEAAAYVTSGVLPPDRVAHAGACKECAALIDMLRGGNSPFMESVWSAFSRHRIIGFLKKGATVAIPAILILGCTYLVLTKIDLGAASQTAPSSPLAWCVIAIGLFFYLVAYRGLGSLPTLRNIVNGVIVGGVFAGFVCVDFLQSRATSDIAFRFARERTESLVLSAMDQQLRTGRFPGLEEAEALTNGPIAHGDPNLNVEVPTNNDERARYIVTLPNMPGKKIVADVHGCSAGESCSGTLTFQDRRLDLTATSGTVYLMKVAGQDSLEFVSADGTKYKIPSPEVYSLRQGQHILAIVDPTTSSVDKYRPMLVRDFVKEK